MKIAVSGFNGKVGSTVRETVEQSLDHSVAFGVSRSADNTERDGVMVYSDFGRVQEDCDGIIDFSHRDNLKAMLDYALTKDIPVVIGTTGFTDYDFKLIEEASRSIPILCSHNTGLGVNIMLGILENMADMLRDFDVEIIENHHNRKEDAPSGTSKMLLEAMQKSRPNLHPIYNRADGFHKRDKDEVGVHSIRGGNTISDHTVIFAGQDDVLTLKHQALTDSSFAKGAVKGLEFINEKDSGVFSMKDVLKGC